MLTWFNHRYAYGAISPVLDLSAGVFPVTRVDQELDQADIDYVPLSEIDEQVHKFCEFSWYLCGLKFIF